MKHFYFSAWLLLALLCLFINAIAQFQTNAIINPDADTTLGNRMRYIFGPLEKSRIPHGLLHDCDEQNSHNHFTNAKIYTAYKPLILRALKPHL